MSARQKLYELEQICDQNKLFKASKSTIVNITIISHVKPYFIGRFETTMENEIIELFDCFLMGYGVFAADKLY